MLPSGEITENCVNRLGTLLEKGALPLTIDGGNSFFKDDIRRGKALAAKDIDYIDVARPAACGAWSGAIA